MIRIFRIFRSPVALAGLVLAAFVLTGLAATFTLGRFSLAQEDTPTAPAPAQDEATATPTEKETLRDDFLNRLAEELGISRDRLDQALTNTALAMVDQAVADGRITEEEATRIREAIQSGKFPFFFGGRGFGHHGFGPGHGWGPGLGHLGVAADELADFLGITTDELRAARADGQSLAQIAEANGKSRDELKSFLTEQARERLDQAVADGKITQERADQMLEDFTARLDDLIDSTGGPCFGGPWWWGAPGEDETTPSSLTL